MPEGVATADGRVTAGVHDDPDSPPPAGPDAPKGWAWQRKSKSWAARQRGPVLWRPDGAGIGPRQEEPRDGAAGASPPSSAAPGDQQDPDPSWLRDEPSSSGSSSGTGSSPGSTGGERLKFEDVPQAVKDDIAGLAGLVGTPILAMLRSLDPYCGTILAESFEPIVDATLPLICRSQKIVRYFTEDKADWLLWGKLAMVLAPVAKAVAEHHIFRTVQVVRDEATGAVTIVRGARQDSEHGDHLQPPVMHAQQYVA